MVCMRVMVVEGGSLLLLLLLGLRLQFLVGFQCDGVGGGGGGVVAHIATQAGVREGGLRANVVHARGRGVHAGSSILAANCRAVNERRETRHLDQLVKGGLMFERQRFVYHTSSSSSSSSSSGRGALGALGALDGRLVSLRCCIRGGAGWWVVQGVEPPAGLPVRQPLGWRAMIVLRLRDEVVPIHIVVCRALRVLLEGHNRRGICKQSTDKNVRNNLDCMSGHRDSGFGLL